MIGFDTVLFDWMMTLAHYPSPSVHLRESLQALGRPHGLDDVAALVSALDTARLDPAVAKLGAIEDTSAAAHLAAEMTAYRVAGFDDELADHLYTRLGTADFHPPYPDAAEVVSALHAAGIAIGVVSDIHVDLRTHAEAFGFGPAIGAWALSWELGIQKPELPIFVHALDALEADPQRTLMVGDRHTRDGAAALLGIRTLVLPAMPDLDPTQPRGLDAVLRLVLG